MTVRGGQAADNFKKPGKKQNSKKNAKEIFFIDNAPGIVDFLHNITLLTFFVKPIFQPAALTVSAENRENLSARTVNAIRPYRLGTQ